MPSRPGGGEKDARKIEEMAGNRREGSGVVRRLPARIKRGQIVIMADGRKDPKVGGLLGVTKMMIGTTATDARIVTERGRETGIVAGIRGGIQKETGIVVVEIKLSQMNGVQYQLVISCAQDGTRPTLTEIETSCYVKPQGLLISRRRGSLRFDVVIGLRKVSDMTYLHTVKDTNEKLYDLVQALAPPLHTQDAIADFAQPILVLICIC